MSLPISSVPAAPFARHPPVRPEVLHTLPPLGRVAPAQPLPLGRRLWQQGALRKALILAVLALLYGVNLAYCAATELAKRGFWRPRPASGTARPDRRALRRDAAGRP